MEKPSFFKKETFGGGKSREHFYSFSVHHSVPSHIRERIDTAPEDVLLDEEFQSRVVSAVLENVRLSESDNGEDLSRWMSVLNGFPARGVEQVASETQELIVTELQAAAAAGHYREIQLLKNLFRPVIDLETFSIDTEQLPEGVATGLVARYERNAGVWYEDLAAARELDPALQTEAAAAVIYEKHIRRFLFRENSGNVLSQICRIRDHYPEMMTSISTDEKLQEDIVLKAYRVHGVDYGPGLAFEAVFGKTIYEAGVSLAAHELVENALTTSIDNAAKFIELLGVNPQEMYQESLMGRIGFRNALSRMMVAGYAEPNDEFYKNIQRYREAFGADGDDIVADEKLSAVFADQVLLPFNLPEAQEVPADKNERQAQRMQSIEAHIERFVAAVGASERGKQYLALVVGFVAQEKGYIAEGAHAHRVHELDYQKPTVSKEEDYFAHSKHEAMNRRLLSLLNRTLRNNNGAEQVRLLEAIAQENNLDSERVAELVVGPLLSDPAIKTVHTLGQMFAGKSVADIGQMPVLNALREQFRDRLGLRRDLQLAAVEQYKMAGSYTEIQPLFEFGIFDETEKQLPVVRELAVGEYLIGVQNGFLANDVQEFFSLDANDIDQDVLQIKAEHGIAHKILTGKGAFAGTIRARRDDSRKSSAQEVRSFAEHFGVGGEHLAQIERAAILKSVKNSRLDELITDVEDFGLPATVFTEDVEFRTAAYERIENLLHTGRAVEALGFFNEFQFESAASQLQDYIYNVWHKNPERLQSILEADWPESVVSRVLMQRIVSAATLYKSDKIKDFQTAVMANEYYTPVIDTVLDRTVQMFGEYSDWQQYRLLSELLDTKNSEIPEELLALGVVNKGEAGVEQLRDGVRNFQKRIITDEITAQELEDSQLLSGIYMDKTRVAVSQWGNQSKDVVIETVRRSGEYLAANPETGLSNSYQTSEVLLVGTVKEQKDFTFDQDFLERYDTVIQSISDAVETVEEFSVAKDKPLTKLVDKIGAEQELLVASLEEKTTEPPSDSLKERAAREAKKSGRLEEEVLHDLQSRRTTQLAASIAELQGVDMRSIKDVQENFSILAKHKELHPLLRETMFTFALLQRDHRARVSDLRDVALGENPTQARISQTLDFVDHIVNQEVMSTYFTDKKAANDFRRINSVVALEKQLRKMTQEADEKKMPVQFVPTRGALLELSGQIADACWANKYDLVAAEFPNITAVTMVGNPGERSEKMVGSALLIETESESGESVLVIRGLNPLENTINKLDLADFYEQFTQWGKEQAQRMGRKLCVVIDDHSGGSATNRPKLFQYLTEQRDTLDQVTLQSSSESNFNGYDIERCTYGVE